MSQTTLDNDGGMFALRGYVFQFDATLISLYKNLGEDSVVTFEHTQDISTKNFCHQVKYRSSKYYDSLIRNAVCQLLEEFLLAPDKKYVLYCHFSDKEAYQWNPTIKELNSILASRKDEFTPTAKNQFLSNFQIVFTEDFTTHFMELIDLLCKVYSCSKDEAVLKHALMRGRILDITLSRSAKKRTISKSDIDRFLESSYRVMFTYSYAKYLTEDKYIKMLKKEFFTIRTPNIENHSRFFIIDASDLKVVEMLKIVKAISDRYFKKGKSPAPYICFRNTNLLDTVKQKLVDKKIIFSDGSRFSGDKFRVSDLLDDAPFGLPVQCRIVSDSHVNLLIGKMDFDEVFEFCVNSEIDLKPFAKSHTRSILIKLNKPIDVIKLM